MAQNLSVKKVVGFLALAVLTSSLSAAQSTQSSPVPQTARQALIEMFFSKTPGTFLEHLPAATVTALAKSGAMPALQPYSAIAGQLQAHGSGVETFDTGAILVAVNDPKTGSKFEIDVVRDSLQADSDSIEVSFHTRQNGEHRAPPAFLPKVTLVMKSESGVWKLNEILMTVRLPLADPDFLKSITEGIKSRSNAVPPAITSAIIPIQATTNAFASDNSIEDAMRSILTAEATYARTYPGVGYTCTLSDLDGFGGGEPNEHQAMLIPSGLAGGKKFGYVFTLSGCAGTPAASFQMVASPAGNVFGRRAFCSNQTATIRYSEDGRAASCLADGTPAKR